MALSAPAAPLLSGANQLSSQMEQASWDTFQAFIRRIKVPSRGLKVISTGQESEKSRCGVWSRRKNVQNCHFKKKPIVNCFYCFALGTEYYLPPVTEGWRHKLYLHSKYKGLNKGKLQWLVALASPDHCTLHWLENYGELRKTRFS